MMVYINHLYKIEQISNIKYLKDFLILLSPFAPHIAEELNEKLGFSNMSTQVWPKWDESKVIANSTIISVQVNGKLRATIEAEQDLNEEQIKEKALSEPNVIKFIGKNEVKKIIYIKNKNINFVV